ncbi:hypothetical protein [Anaerosolibacter sp.]|uniref:hypothetical protein n=1 Tax=Anaerosolibacter sp. TaxID=1872527 RepID=UPI0039F0BA65
MFEDISPNFEWNPVDANIAKRLIDLEETPEAIQYFSRVCHKLTDYAYWFLLSTLWVSYTGFTDINLWKKLFSEKRPYRLTSIMKPSELKAFQNLPKRITIYRAHRPNETDWIAYTLDFDIAKRFARERQVNIITEYRIKKADVTALFLRRGENEIIALDKSKIQFIKEYKIED